MSCEFPRVVVELTNPVDGERESIAIGDTQGLTLSNTSYSVVSTQSSNLEYIYNSASQSYLSAYSNSCPTDASHDYELQLR